MEGERVIYMEGGGVFFFEAHLVTTNGHGRSRRHPMHTALEFSKHLIEMFEHAHLLGLPVVQVLFAVWGCSDPISKRVAPVIHRQC